MIGKNQDVNWDDFCRIPEDSIKYAQEALEMIDPENSNNSNFVKVLELVDEYRSKGCTPMVLFNPQSHNMIVVIEETFNKKLH